MYNSVHYDDTEMSTLCDKNVNDIHVHCIANPSKHKHTHCITVEQVKFAINKLQTGKSDSTNGLSDNLKNDTYLLYSYIALLCTCMLTHGVSSIDFCLFVIVPIPKNKRANKCDSSNYRAIAISSLLGKILDNIISSKINILFLSTDVLQFGYNRCSSTTICTSYYWRQLLIIMKIYIFYCY